jgi:hypothetical protein
MAEEKERRRFGTDMRTSTEQRNMGWEGYVNWDRVAESFQPFVDNIGEKLQERRDAKDKLAQEEGYADSKSMRKGQDVAELEEKMEGLDPESRKYKRLERRAKRKASKIGYTEDLTKKEVYTALPDNTNNDNTSGDEDENENDQGSPNEANVENFFPLLKNKGKISSPIKFGKADTTLVKVAGQVARSSYGAPTGQAMGDALNKIWQNYTDKLKEAKKIELDAYDFSKTSKGFDDFGNGRTACTNFLKDKKTELAKLKEKALKTPFKGRKYRSVLDEITKLETEVETLNNNMSRIQQQKDMWAEANGHSGDNMTGISQYSKGSDGTKINFMDQIMTKNAELFIDTEDGNAIKFMVTGKDGEKYPMTYEQASQGVFLKDIRGQKRFSDYRKKMVDDLRINRMPFREDQALADITYLLEDASYSRVTSWMHDDIDGDGKSFIDDYAQFNKDLVETYPDAFKPGSELWNTSMGEDSEFETFGDYMVAELKEYYVERLRSEYNMYNTSLNRKKPSEPKNALEDFEQFILTDEQ